ncbi:MAG: hypothetical protein ACR2G5_14350 [Pyrinomonadaceae bacterium]
MTSLQIAHQRLHNQHLSSPGFKKAVDVATFKNNSGIITVNPLEPLSKAETKAIAEAAER